jgi:hypothetical protein
MYWDCPLKSVVTKSMDFPSGVLADKTPFSECGVALSFALLMDAFWGGIGVAAGRAGYERVEAVVLPFGSPGL